MKYNLLLLAALFGLRCPAQNKFITQDSIIKKWELATINIEAKTSLFMEPSISENFRKKLDSSNLTPGEKNQQIIKLIHNMVGSSGTAVFLEYEHIYFLLTARHVLEDSYFPQAGFPYNQLFFPENANTTQSSFIPAFLYLMPADTNLHVCNFIFSSKDIDIAIIALDGYSYETGICNIPKILLGRGQKPIQISDIDTNYRSHAGDLTFAIGFPDLSMIGTKPSEDTFQIFQSNQVTMPVVAKGHVLVPSYVSPYLISDVFVYHGNSGGPLIHENKLVGIVHGANLETREIKGEILKKYYFLNGNQFIKSVYILPLLRQLVSQIKYNRSIPSRS